MFEMSVEEGGYVCPCYNYARQHTLPTSALPTSPMDMLAMLLRTSRPLAQRSSRISHHWSYSAWSLHWSLMA